MALLSVDEALARILDGALVTGVERVPLMEAAHRILTEDVRATLTQPPFNASAMDGYAVRAADVATLPARLTLIGEARAGEAFSGSVGAGQCARIFTGAPVPAGADAIVIQENTKADGSIVTVVEGSPDPAHIRPRGGDFAEGQVLLSPGRVLDARAVLLAAAMGHGTLAVRKKPVIAVLATGDELVDPGQKPGPDQIVSSNPYGLAAMIAAAGGEPRLLGIARDTRTALEEKIAAGGGRGCSGDDGRRVGRRSRSRRAGADVARHDDGFLEDRHAAGQADAVWKTRNAAGSRASGQSSFSADLRAGVPDAADRQAARPGHVAMGSRARTFDGGAREEWTAAALHARCHIA